MPFPETELHARTLTTGALRRDRDCRQVVVDCAARIGAKFDWTATVLAAGPQ